jgi:hypothetical protein
MFLFSASPTRGRIPLLGGDVVPGSDLGDYRVTVRQSNGKCELSLATRTFNPWTQQIRRADPT